MDESALNAAMDSAMKRGNSKTQIITEKEAASFKKAFAKPEFRDMFNDYLKEVLCRLVAESEYDLCYDLWRWHSHHIRQ